MRIRNVLVCAAIAVLISGCGSSGGSSTPPAPPAPVAPPPPPPEPTFDERLADWAAMDPNPCRARTPGFEAFGGWLKDDGREVGASRVWMRDTGELSDASSHGARVWKTLTECGVRANEDHYFSNSSNFFEHDPHGKWRCDCINFISSPVLGKIFHFQSRLCGGNTRIWVVES